MLRSPTSPPHAALALAALLLAGPAAARARDVDPADPPATPTPGTAVVDPPTEPDENAFRLSTTGMATSFGVGLSRLGGTGLGELGGRSTGITTLDHSRLLLRWDALGAARGGYFGNAMPLTSIVGGRVAGDVAVGVRLRPEATASPYLGARASLDLIYLLPQRSLAEVGAMDGLAGLNVRAGGRLEAGLSRLWDHRSLLVLGFVQESWRSATPSVPSFAFTELGVGVRLDVAHRLTLSAEGSLGFRPTLRDPTLGRSDATTFQRLDLGARKYFRNGMWLGADFTFERALDRITYRKGGTYRTAGAPGMGFTVSFGMPFGGR